MTVIRVSILIPTYARPEHLRACISAALASRYEDLEVLVGDDGTAGADVCDSFDDARLRYHRNPHRLGMALNWNSLLDRATGDLLALCMDDDRLAPEYIETCVKVFCADPSLGVVFTNHTFVDQSRMEQTRRSLITAGRHDAFARAFVLHRPVAVSAAMFRRQAWHDVRPLPDTAAADMVLFGRLAEAGWPFYYVNAPLMAYGTHGAMLSGTAGFRADRVTAWRSLTFTDPEAEQHRRRLLGEALLSLARLHLQNGDKAAARADLRRARDLGLVDSNYRLVITYLASRGPAAFISAGASIRRRVRGLFQTIGNRRRARATQQGDPT